MKDEEPVPIIVEPYRIKDEEDGGNSSEVLKAKKLEFDSQASSSVQ